MASAESDEALRAKHRPRVMVGFVLIVSSPYSITSES